MEIQRAFQIALTLCLPLTFLPAGCSDSAESSFCFTNAFCNFDMDGRVNSCFEIEDCQHTKKGTASPSAERQVDFEATFLEAGEGRIDIEVQTFGDEVGGGTSVGVRWLGQEISDLRFQGRKDLWRFRGLPASAVDQIEVSIPGTDLRTRRSLQVSRIDAPAECNPRERLPLSSVLPDLSDTRDGLAVGDVIPIRAPRTEEVLAAGRAVGLAIEVFPPDQEDGETTMIPEGEQGVITVDRPGRWFFRAILLAEDICQPATAELIVIQEAEIFAR